MSLESIELDSDWRRRQLKICVCLLKMVCIFLKVVMKEITKSD